MTKLLPIHPSITLARVTDAVEREMIGLDNPGFCLACGKESGCCEPDARKYTCEFCEQPQVYGAAELLIMGAHHE